MKFVVGQLDWSWIFLYLIWLTLQKPTIYYLYKNWPEISLINVLWLKLVTLLATSFHKAIFQSVTKFLRRLPPVWITSERIVNLVWSDLFWNFVFFVLRVKFQSIVPVEKLLRLLIYCGRKIVSFIFKYKIMSIVPNRKNWFCWFCLF